MKCCVAGCSYPVESIYYGFSLCADCMDYAYEWDDETDPAGMMHFIDSCQHAPDWAYPNEVRRMVHELIASGQRSGVIEWARVPEPVG